MFVDLHKGGNHFREPDKQSQFPTHGLALLGSSTTRAPLNMEDTGSVIFHHFYRGAIHSQDRGREALNFSCLKAGFPYKTDNLCHQFGCRCLSTIHDHARHHISTRFFFLPMPLCDLGQGLHSLLDAIAREDAENLRHTASCLRLLNRLTFPALSLHMLSEIVDSLLRDMVWKPTFYVEINMIWFFLMISAANLFKAIS